MEEIGTVRKIQTNKEDHSRHGGSHERITEALKRARSKGPRCLRSCGHKTLERKEQGERKSRREKGGNGFKTKTTSC